MSASPSESTSDEPRSFVEVVVDAPGARGSTFFYSVPPHLESPAPLQIGQLLAVPFGTMIAQAVIVGISDRPPDVPTRLVRSVLDARPLIGPERVQLARWIANHYRCALVEAFGLMIPAGVRRRPETILRPGSPGDDVVLSERERAVYEMVVGRRQIFLSRDRAILAQIGTAGQLSRAIRRLVELGLLQRESTLTRAEVAPRVEQFVGLAVPAVEAEQALAELGRAQRQHETLSYLIDQTASSPFLPAGLVREATGATAQVLRALVERGLIQFQSREVQRDPLAHRTFPRFDPPPLTEDQTRALSKLRAALDSGRYQPTLLHGVTGSGKTEIYLQLIAAAIARGKRAIVLVPEIALTPQTIHRFGARFPGRIAVLHSRLTPGERFDEWRKIRSGAVDVVVGSRSALFAPVHNLGVVVVDEEHERSYKNPATPRYHARDVALKLGELAGLTVVLGSATPDLGTFYRAERGELTRIELPKRIELNRGSDVAPTTTTAGLPPIELVDLRAELRGGNRSIFSQRLRDAITVALSLREQVILFLNRRGNSTFVLCRDCGFVMRCARCEVPLVYHSASEDLVCHLCDSRVAAPKGCPSCWGEHIRYFGIGTQKLEQETRQAFPQARVVRWDSDSAVERGAHERFLNAFINREADILVGTQMIAKGIDLPQVTLVGVISADATLHLPDFRSAEQTFQLLTQVAGRAGRGFLGGRVIVQAYTPEHYGIQHASRHDYLSFYQQEMQFRRDQGYPPIAEMVRLLHVGYGRERIEAEAKAIAHQLRLIIRQRGIPNVDLMGPAPAFHHKVRGRFRWQIILRGHRLAEALDHLSLPRGWIVDVDPVSTL